jgi:sensor histidine kinase YesM
MSGIPRTWIKLSEFSMDRLGSSKSFGVFCIFVIWMVFAVLAGYANYLDLRANGRDPILARQLHIFSMLLLPIPILSSALYLFFEKYQEQIFQPRNLVLLLCFLLFLFLPSFIAYEMTYVYVRAKKAWPNFSDLLGRFSVSQVLIDGVIVLFAASMQIAYAYWRRALRQFSLSTATEQEILTLRLQRLQGQLEPGFLLHSLNQVANFVVVADQKKATRAIVRLSELLRYVLDSQQQAHLSIADEIHFLQDYLELRNLHFNDHLQIDWDLDDVDWREYRSPALLLHPILEFAIESIQEKLLSEKASIRMTIRESLQSIQVCVLFSSDEIVGRVSTENLRMAKERLEILYGENATLQTIQSDVLANSATDHVGKAYTHGLVMLIPSQRI